MAKTRRGTPETQANGCAVYGAPIGMFGVVQFIWLEAEREWLRAEVSR